MHAKLIFCNVPSDDTQKSLKFYSTLLGIGVDDFAQSPSSTFESYQYLISADGIDLKVSKRAAPQEPVVFHFAVDNLANAITQLQAVGGTVVVRPEALQIAPEAVAEMQKTSAGQPVSPTMGQWALLRDPAGNLVGLTELAPQAHRHFKWGAHRVSLSTDQLDEQKKVKDLSKVLKKKP